MEKLRLTILSGYGSEKDRNQSRQRNDRGKTGGLAYAAGGGCVSEVGLVRDLFEHRYRTTFGSSTCWYIDATCAPDVSKEIGALGVVFLLHWALHEGVARLGCAFAQFCACRLRIVRVFCSSLKRPRTDPCPPLVNAFDVRAARGRKGVVYQDERGVY